MRETYFERNRVDKRTPTKTDDFNQKLEAALVMLVSESIVTRALFVPVGRQDIIRVEKWRRGFVRCHEAKRESIHGCMNKRSDGIVRRSERL